MSIENSLRKNLLEILNYQNIFNDFIDIKKYINYHNIIATIFLNYKEETNMKKLFKCTVCGYIAEGEVAPEKCPKCNVGADKFVELSGEDAEKIYSADRTNDIHMEIIALASKIEALCKEGIEINLDPNCLGAFNKAKNEVWVIKQRSKAEIAGHVGKGKW